MSLGECALCPHYDSEHDRTSPQRCNARYCDDQVNDGEIVAHHCNPCECPGFSEAPDDESDPDDYENLTPPTPPGPSHPILTLVAAWLFVFTAVLAAHWVWT